MSVSALRKEEQLGLGVAIAAHIALGVLLWLQPGKRDVQPVPERMTVSLAEDVGLTSTAPNPAENSQAAIAPTLSELPAPPEAGEPVTETAPRDIAQPPPPPRPRATSQPRPRATSAPRPRPRQTTAPTPPRPRASATPAPPRPSPRPTSGGSRLGDDFLEGASAGERTGSSTPAARIGPAEQASLGQAINRQLKPHWTAPQGPDSELLVTILAWDLNEDGSLSGRPRVVDQQGINDTNKAQAARHAEQAVRAVQLAAPFDLPPQFYNGWKRIRSWRFDRKLSQ